MLNCAQLFYESVDCGLPGSLSMEFPRQEFWSRLPFPSPGNLPNPGTGPTSPTLQVVSCIAIGFFTAEPPAKPMQMFSSDIFTQGKRSILSSAFQVWCLCPHLSSSAARLWRQGRIRGHPQPRILCHPVV